jgi:cytochrome c
VTLRVAAILGSWIIWLAGLALTGCRGGRQPAAYAPTNGGDPDRGRTLVAARSCGVCHVIPGVVGAAGVIGPSLAGVARRDMIPAGLPNTTDNLAHWVRDPEGLEPKAAMPNLGLDETQARDVAAFLETLREDQ